MQKLLAVNIANTIEWGCLGESGCNMIVYMLLVSYSCTSKVKCYYGDNQPQISLQSSDYNRVWYYFM